MAKENKEIKVGEKTVVLATVLTPLRHNDIRYEIGSKVELNTKDFKELEKRGIVAKRVEE